MGIPKKLRLMSAVDTANQVSAGFDLGVAASDTVVGPILGLLASALVALWRITTPCPMPDPPTDRFAGSAQRPGSSA